VRINGRRLLKIPDSLSQSGLVSLVPEVAPGQVSEPRLRVHGGGVSGLDGLGSGQFPDDRRGNGGRDLILKGELVGRFTAVAGIP
jgi:hypothetical protein